MILTIITGVAIFVFGQILIKVWIEPLQEFRKIITDVFEELTKYEGVMLSPQSYDDEQRQDAKKNLSLIAIKLDGKVDLIPFYDVVRRVYRLPSLSHVKDSFGKINVSANNLTNNSQNDSVDAHEAKKKAMELLGYQSI